jgi:putative ABC transport system permease protein
VNARFVRSMFRREARASVRRLGLYGGCMALGIAALVGIHGLRITVNDAIDVQAQRLFGADLRVESGTPLDEQYAALVDDLAARASTEISHVTRFGSMALIERSGHTRLVDVHALEGGFPFYGAILTEPEGLWRRLQRDDHVALVDPSLLVQLDARVGDTLALGRARFSIQGTIRRAPGTLGVRTQMAPRVFIARRYVDETQLVQRGSMVNHLLYASAPERILQPWLESHRKTLERARVRLKTVDEYQSDLGESFTWLTQYMSLVGLAALLLGAVGVAAGVRVLVREKLDAVAVLRSLGANSRDIFACYGLLALSLGFAAGVLGSALGVALQWTLPVLMAGMLPVEVEPRIEAAAVATGIALGLWISGLFAASPLLGLSRVPPLRALRRDFGPTPDRRRGLVALVSLLAVSLLGAALWEAPDHGTGVGVAVGLATALAALALFASAITRLLRKHPIRRAPFWLRQGVANLFRPRNHTVAVTLSIGFGLFVVATLHSVQYNVRRQIAVDARPDRPNLVLFDVQSDQLAGVESMLDSREMQVLDRAPLISARIAGLGNRESTEILASEDTHGDQRWAVRREYRLTYSDALRSTERLVEGPWWPAQLEAGVSPIPVSLETSIAEALEVKLGDTIDWNIQGVRIRTRVRNLREVDWRRLAVNFFAVFPPGVIEGAPESTVLLARHPEADVRAALQRDLVVAFPNVSVIDASLILIAIDAMHREMGLAVHVLALVTLATGFLILVASAASARNERTREVLLLRTLGASSQTVRRILATESLTLGAVAAATGTAMALVAAWAIVRFIFALPFDPPVTRLLLFALATAVASGAIGSADLRRERARSPLVALREAEWRGTGA